MEMHFSVAEGRVLHGLLEDASGDIVVRLDPAGFILHASENSSELGIDLSGLLLMPHIADFAAEGHAPEVSKYVAQSLVGKAEKGWIEFPIKACTNPSDEHHDCDPDLCHRWYAFSVKPVASDGDTPQGALGLLRSIQQRHALEGEINTRALTDPLTGLANRHAFCARMRRAIYEGEAQVMVVLAIDRLRAVFMQYGQRTADEILWGFAKFLETMTMPGQKLAQLDDERFGVMLPSVEMKEARVWADDVITTFAGLTVSGSNRAPELTASAGLARVEVSVDWTLRQAELGLILARAGGGMQTRSCDKPAGAIANSAIVERAMEEAVQRAEKRRA